MKRPRQDDYSPVFRSRARRSPTRDPGVVNKWQGHVVIDPKESSVAINSESKSNLLKPGHALSYAALFLFTIILYARPGEFYPSPFTASIALIVGLVTLALFIPTQFVLENRLSAPLREVNLVILFGLLGALSIPFAISRVEAWHEFSGTFIRCIVMFVVIVNVVRTEARLNGLLFLALAAAMWLSVDAINEYRLGLLTVEGYRAAGRGAGIFGNTNDMALHVVTILPIVIALLFSSRGLARRLLFGACALVMIAAIILSYSRGAFLGLVVISIFLAMKLGRKRRLEIALAVLGLAGALILLAPDRYGVRLLSIFFPSLDPNGSADNRRGELLRSINVALHHPLLGIGMGNYQPEMSYKGLVTHNSYTQVASEIGLAALVCYTTFIVSPLRKLARITRDTFGASDNSRFYYLALGLQGSLIAYMVSSFFLSVSYNWYVFYLVSYAVCLRRLYEANTGKVVVIEKRRERQKSKLLRPLIEGETEAIRA
jgi:O-antigen ligase